MPTCTAHSRSSQIVMMQLRIMNGSWQYANIHNDWRHELPLRQAPYYEFALISSEFERPSPVNMIYDL